jgi:predicted RNA-binding protein
MCEANVYLNTDEGKEELLMEGVNILRPEGIRSQFTVCS